MLSPLKTQTKQDITEKDIPKIKHNCITLYGYDWWCTVGLDEMFEQLPLINKTINNQENLRLCTLKYYGVKNPK